MVHEIGFVSLDSCVIVGTLSPQLRTGAGGLLNSLSYSHFELLIDIDEPFKRTFYEIESMRGNWSVRELKRQIGSLYYERSGLSENKGKRRWIMGGEWKFEAHRKLVEAALSKKRISLHIECENAVQ